ncbi:hypothetical protein H6P81_000719 [Aristolochia fimbriata]|uniref:RING-type domain-containing protein n=1 Tax=Aristolochia fimbriata TaxID=158543 RepID=A0AAV7F8S6_ARIFI|nr:hypothetical protein H6P81_000719 [Aristolochia fimbriata]
MGRFLLVKKPVLELSGMLPGVECARRRRFHQGGSMDTASSTSKSSTTSTRRSSFCLYASNHIEAHPISSNSNLQRSFSNQELRTHKLGYAAREARERLDGRLRSTTSTQGKSQPTRSNSTGAIDLQKLLGLKKRKWSLFSWGFKQKREGVLKQEECAVCLEAFKPQELLLHLPCCHRFHYRCLTPWLEENSHCPCCRTGIFS